MLISFELSMPSVASWDGKWSGAGKLYVRVMSFRKPPTLPDGKQLAGSRHTYNFSDGWVAAVTVREVTSSAAKQLRKDSAGFCGYDWMIKSILQHGEILA